MKSLKVERIPLRKIKLVTPSGITRQIGAFPGGQKVARSRSQRIVGNIEGMGRLYVGSRKDPGKIKPVGSQRFQIAVCIDGPV